MRTIVLVVIIGFFAGLLKAATIHVPSDQPTIQAGIDATSEGDTVLVAPGTYTGAGNRDIDFAGKNLVVRSAAGPGSTSIDCEGDSTLLRRAFIFQSGEDSTSVVDGFTITGGYSEKGGGVYCGESSRPIINNCILTRNFAVSGGAIYVTDGSSLNVRNCRVSRNTAVVAGGGVTSTNVSSIRMTDCIIKENTAGLGGGVAIAGLSSGNLANCLIADNTAAGTGYYGLGGGCFFGDDSYPHLTNCTLVGNHAERAGSAILATWGSRPSVTNCIVAYNVGVETMTCEADGNPSSIQLECSDVFGNAGGDWIGCIADQADTDGNFSSDPLFCDTAIGDFHIYDASECNPANNACESLVGALQVECSNTWASLERDVICVFEANSVSPLDLSVYVGDFPEGHVANDIDPTSIIVNSVIVPDSSIMVESHPEVDGEVLRIVISLKQFILSYDSPRGNSSQKYTISATFLDGKPFLAADWFFLLGRLPGDLSGDSFIDVSDLMLMIDYMFRDGFLYDPTLAADVDGSSTVDIADLVFLVDYMFRDGDPPLSCL